jgi:hypothetical protein
MTNDSADVRRLEQMISELQAMRTRLCEPKDKSNPRYHAFSLAVTNLRKAADDLRSEDG